MPGASRSRVRTERTLRWEWVKRSRCRRSCTRRRWTRRRRPCCEPPKAVVSGDALPGPSVGVGVPSGVAPSWSPISEPLLPRPGRSDITSRGGTSSASSRSRTSCRPSCAPLVGDDGSTLAPLRRCCLADGKREVRGREQEAEARLAAGDARAISSAGPTRGSGRSRAGAPPSHLGSRRRVPSPRRSSVGPARRPSRRRAGADGTSRRRGRRLRARSSARTAASASASASGPPRSASKNVR